MAYPRQLKLSDPVEEDLIQTCESFIFNHLGERTAWIEEVNQLQRESKAEPSEDKPTFPFVGASNLVVPLIAIAKEAVHSRNMQKLNAMKDHIAIDIYDNAVSDIKDPLEDYLDQEIFVYGKFVKEFEPAVLEIEGLGTGVAEAVWQEITKKGYITTGEGKEKSVDVVIKKGTVIESVPITSFMMPFDSLDPQTAPWVGNVFWLNPQELSQWEWDGMFREGTVEKLEQYFTAPTVQVDDALKTTQQQEENEDRKPAFPTRIQFYKLYLSYCVDPTDEEVYERLNIPRGDDELREICVIYHRESRQLVSCWYNWNKDLRRPYRYANYFPIEYRWSGIGIYQQNRQFQEEVTIQHRQTIDSGTIANARMWKVKKGATSVREGDAIYPNKIWFVDDMDDIVPFKNDDIYASSYNNENSAMILSQQRTGVNELTLGMPGVGTPGTATDSLNRVQEGARKNDYTFSNIKMLADQLLHDSLLNIVQYGPNLNRLKYNPRGPEIEQFLKRPFEDFQHQVICRIQLINQNDNRVLDRQTMTQLTGILQQYYTQINPIIQQLADPNINPQVAVALRSTIEGANRALKKVLYAFEERDPDKYLILAPKELPPAPPPQPQLNAGPIQNDPGGIPGVTGSNPSSNVSNISVNAPNLQNVLPPQIASRLFPGGIPTQSGGM